MVTKKLYKDPKQPGYCHAPRWDCHQGSGSGMVRGPVCEWPAATHVRHETDVNAAGSNHST